MEKEDSDPVFSVLKWEDFLQDFSKDEDYIHGYVTEETSVDNVLELYRRATKTTFFTRRSSCFYFDPIKFKNRKFYTRSFVFCRSVSPRISNDGVPFMYGGMKTLECQYGPKREHGKKSDVKTVTGTVSSQTIDSTLEYTKFSKKKKANSRVSTGETRKKGCRAKISVWHICRLPEYAVTAKKCVTIWQTRAKERLLQDLEAGKEVAIESRFYISLPLMKTHTNHSPCGQSDEAHSVHPQVIRWIDQLVAEGVTTIRDVQAALKHYVQTTMCDVVAPDTQDRAYYPTLKDIANHIYKSKVKQRIVKLELEQLGVEEVVHSEGGSYDTTENGLTDTASSPLHCLQLYEPDTHSEITVPIEEVTGCPDEDVYRERKELHKELTLIRKLSNNCTDAATLAELKAGIAAIHYKFKSSFKGQSSSPLVSADTLTPKRQKQENGDHVY